MSSTLMDFSHVQLPRTAPPSSSSPDERANVAHKKMIKKSPSLSRASDRDAQTSGTPRPATAKAHIGAQDSDSSGALKPPETLPCGATPSLRADTPKRTVGVKRPAARDADAPAMTSLSSGAADTDGGKLAAAKNDARVVVGPPPSTAAAAPPSHAVSRATVTTTKPAKRARAAGVSTAKKAVPASLVPLTRTIKDALHAAFVEEFYPSADANAPCAQFAAKGALTASVHEVISRLVNKNEEFLAQFKEANTASAQVSAQLDDLLSNDNRMRGGKSALLKVVVELSPAQHGHDDDAAKNRSRAAKLLYLVAKAEDALLDELCNSSELNVLAAWLQEFRARQEWKSMTFVLYFLNAVPMTTESLRKNKDLARKVSELSKLQADVPAKADHNDSDASAAMHAVEVRAKKLRKKWVESIRAEHGEGTDLTTAKPKTAAEPEKAAPAVFKRAPLPAPTTGAAPADLRRVKTLSDDDLFGGAPAPKRKQAPKLDSSPRIVRKRPTPSASEKTGSHDAVAEDEPPRSAETQSRSETPSSPPDKHEEPTQKPGASSSQPDPPANRAKRVSWAAGDRLVSARLIETRGELSRMFYSERSELMQPTNRDRTIEHGDHVEELHDMEVERLRLHKVSVWRRLEHMGEEVAWRAPSPLVVSEELPRVAYDGADAAERRAEAQNSREVFPNVKRVSTPAEPPYAPHIGDNNTPTIPLEPIAAEGAAMAKKPTSAAAAVRSTEVQIEWHRPRVVILPAQLSRAEYAGTEGKLLEALRAHRPEALVRAAGEELPPPAEAPAEAPADERQVKRIPLEEDESAEAEAAGEAPAATSAQSGAQPPSFADEDKNALPSGGAIPADIYALASMLQSVMPQLSAVGAPPAPSTQTASPAAVGASTPQSHAMPPPAPPGMPPLPAHNDPVALQTFFQHLSAQGLLPPPPPPATKAAMPAASNFPAPPSPPRRTDSPVRSHLSPPLAAAPPPPPAAYAHSYGGGRGAGAAPPRQHHNADHPRRAGGNARRVVCHFYKTPRGCMNGDQCRFVHE